MVELTKQTREDMARLAGDLALFARAGTAILISGDLGAGKTELARSLIAALAPAGAAVEVVSPTFTIVQDYDELRVPVRHADLYRIGSAAELTELDLDSAEKMLVIEWPERGRFVDQEDRLEIALSGQGSTRTIRLEGYGYWRAALERTFAIARFLEASHFAGAPRRFLQGDASFRRYERLSWKGQSRVLMDMPARPDGPPIAGGKSYSKIAHLAEDISAVLAVNRALIDFGYSAPETYAYDLKQGLAVIEDLGDDVYGRRYVEGVPLDEPLAAAVALLVDMAGRNWPRQVGIDGGALHVVPDYDEEAQLVEVDLLLSWMWPRLHGGPPPAEAAADFRAIWMELLPLTRKARPIWVLRDFHSPNLLWLPERSGHRRVGLIDTQDCVMGDPAYDLVSLLQDARVDVDEAMSAKFFAQYCGLRAGDSAFDREAFAASFAVLGAQRATKILGIFSRLSMRDGKHIYLAHIPRVSRYLETNLRHPALAPLGRWFAQHLPRHLREAGR
ncbi:MAG: tRNA (adenosine(37)-N6)-threonylcarbamoyltransferase complex ATPase subunit type 1 TsaE [Alphaproteobacteria bacterium]|nr:tRNA (adenosine(37)-N6)-threonylcarbamoyltransferase complex ATPase subunit type 1 TsaE [Alphaproteobacteria bacterium]